MATQEWKRIIYEKKDGIARVLMNRPEMRNAQDDLMCREIGQAIRMADADDEVRVIILGGVGGTFTSGHDMSGRGLPTEGVTPGRDIQTIEDHYEREMNIYYREMLSVRNTSKPTIAEISGYCIAAGVTIACMCDIMIAAENAIFQNPVLRMTSGANELLIEPWDIGVRAAKYFLFTGDPIDAKEAWRLGFVNKVVPTDKLEEETMRVAKKIALMPPSTIRRVKRSLNKVLDFMGQRDHWDYHIESHIISHWSNEARALREEDRKLRESGSSLKELLKKRDDKFKV